MGEEGGLVGGMKIGSGLGALVGVHAEGESMTRYFTDHLASEGRVDPRAIAEGRPPIAEYEAMQRAIVLARHADSRLHFVHMSIPEGADLVQASRRAGVQVTAETCPHYLHFDWTTLDRLGAFAKCKPPLRSEGSSARLWQAALAGKISLPAADQAPC